MSNETVGLHHVTFIEADKSGFIRDEFITELGTELTLPPWLESEQDMLEQCPSESESASVPEAH